jgi:periplasmic mercuric ion binding protein
MNNLKTASITAVMTLVLFFAAYNATFALFEVEEVKIKTSAMCNDCKEEIEKCLHRTVGVNEAELNLDDSIVTIKYNTAKINPDKLRKVISKAGFDADEVKAVKQNKCYDICKDQAGNDKQHDNTK